MNDKIKLDSIEDAIADFKEGKFLIVVDDEDRENEGDFIIAAEKITPEKVNFMLKHARGVLCAPITLQRCKELDLDVQVSDNTSMLGTPFTVTVDKLEGCSTGVSAHDRAATIRALADPNAKPADFGRPGHINPLYAQDKGVLRRTGHTEAAVDLARLAGLYPAGALMEIMNDDGTMARLPELKKNVGGIRNKADFNQRLGGLSPEAGVDCGKRRRSGYAYEVWTFPTDTVLAEIEWVGAYGYCKGRMGEGRADSRACAFVVRHWRHPRLLPL